MFFNDLYYKIKPFLTRKRQIQIRRFFVNWKRVANRNIWPIDHDAGKTPKGWPGWPEGKHFALVLTHDVETFMGVEKVRRLMDVEKSLGLRSSFNFVVEDYRVDQEIRSQLIKEGFEVGIHGLNHDINIFNTKSIFSYQAKKINKYLRSWGTVGFRHPCMYHNLDLIQKLNILYDTSTFDTDPFEPQPDGVGTIFPFWVPNATVGKGYVELPYTLPQDFTLFVLMREKNIDIWKRKIDWIAEKGGMALSITHPDYMNFNSGNSKIDEYPHEYYKDFLEYVVENYRGKYWHALPKDVARFWMSHHNREKEENMHE